MSIRTISIRLLLLVMLTPLLVFAFPSKSQALTLEQMATADLRWDYEPQYPDNDEIEYYEVDKEHNTITFDSTRGPRYTINYQIKTIMDCTSDGCKIVSFSLKGSTLNVTLYSNELPVNTNYSFDISQNGYFSLYTYNDEDFEYGHYSVYNNNMLDFDTNWGPSYLIDYNKALLINCSSSGARIVSLSTSGNTLTLTVYSDEFPVERTYTFDLSHKDPGNIVTTNLVTDYSLLGEDHIGWFTISGGILSFDSDYGPAYDIDIKRKKILSCSSDWLFENQDKARIISLEETDQFITLKVWSAELPIEATYVFDKAKAASSGSNTQFLEETIDYYNVFEKSKIIEFDTSGGPWYSIDYKNKEILGCTSSGAKIKKLSIENKKLKIRLYSDERPTATTYTFDLTKNNCGEYNESMGYSSVSYDGSSFAGQDYIDYFNIYRDDGILEFDSVFGPLYQIDLANKKILDCTSDGLYPNDPPAVLLACNDYGDFITVKVYSTELPYKMTYTFDLTKNSQTAGIAEYNDKKIHDEVNSILKKVKKGTYQGNGLNAKTLEKVKKAQADNKEILPVVFYKSVSPDDLDKTTQRLIEEYVENNDYSLVQCLNISIYLYADKQKIGEVTELENKVKFTLFVDQDESDSAESFNVVQVHNKKASALGAKGSKKVTFKTKEFSSYALVKTLPAHYKVKFNMMGHGKQISSQKVAPYKKATKPATPTAKGYRFKGWYTDKKLNNSFSFDSKVKKNLTLYAKWTKVKKDTEFSVGSGNKKCKYVVLDQSKKTVGFKGVSSKKISSIKVPDTVDYCGYTYKVVSVEKKALYKNKSTKTVELGKNIKKINEKAFSKCKKLEEVKISSTKLTTIKADAFRDSTSLKKINISSEKIKVVETGAMSGIAKKATIDVPNNCKAKYKKLFKKAGLSAKATVK